MRPVRVPSRWLAGVLAVTVGCATLSASPTPRPAPIASAPAARDPLAAPWNIVRSAGSFAREIRLVSELVSRVDSVERSDTTVATLSVSWSRLAGAAPARISGLVSAYRVGGGSREPEPVPGLLLPVPFSATEGRGSAQAAIETPASGACGLAAAALQPVRELLVSPPARLEPGTLWSDSASYEICRDSIPLRVRSVRTFRVVGAELRGSEVIVLVDRTSSVTLVGEGTQFGERLSIAADGSGAMRLELRQQGGALFAARGESELRMTMRGRRRSQELRQHTRIEIDSP